MDNLKRRVDVLTVLKRKNRINDQAASKAYNICLKQLEQAEKRLNENQSELTSCNKRLSDGYVSVLDIEAIKSINRYCESLDFLIATQKYEVEQAQINLKESKLALNKIMIKGKAFNKLRTNTIEQFEQLTQKSLDKVIEDNWVSQRFQG